MFLPFQEKEPWPGTDHSELKEELLRAALGLMQWSHQSVSWLIEDRELPGSGRIKSPELLSTCHALGTLIRTSHRSTPWILLLTL